MLTSHEGAEDPIESDELMSPKSVNPVRGNLRTNDLEVNFTVASPVLISLTLSRRQLAI